MIFYIFYTCRYIHILYLCFDSTAKSWNSFTQNLIINAKCAHFYLFNMQQWSYLAMKHATLWHVEYCIQYKLNTVSNNVVLHSETIRWKLTSILFFLLCPLDKPGNKKHPQTSSTSLTLSDTTQRSLHFIWTGKTKTPRERKREFLQAAQWPVVRVSGSCFQFLLAVFLIFLYVCLFQTQTGTIWITMRSCDLKHCQEFMLSIPLCLLCVYSAFIFVWQKCLEVLRYDRSGNLF